MDSRTPRLDDASPPTNQGGEPMGDKSPKAKEKAKKQDASDKNQRKATAAAKVLQQGAAGAVKKGR
jgi:hypothetical protein